MPADDGIGTTDVSEPWAASTADELTDPSVVEARLLRDLDIANDWHPEF